MDILSYLEKKSKKIDLALEHLLPREGGLARRLHEAMRYAVLGGGKRVRPVLTLAACEAVGGGEDAALPAACAIELIHSYSLVHDDLPCMDDDDVRRGRPSCHKKYGEVTALLAGDALLTKAFEILAGSSDNGNSAGLKRRLAVIGYIAEAAGDRGMVGGQSADVDFQDKDADVPTLEYINTHKSGALIAAAARTGACLGGGTAAEIEALHRYGKNVGLLFQIVDDILDEEGYSKLVGPAEAKLLAEDLHRKAKKELSRFGKKAVGLEKLADFILTRKH